MANSGRTLKESADFTRGSSTPTPDHDSDLAARKVRVREEQLRLIQWARVKDKLGPKRPIPEFARGGEHIVYFPKRNHRYFKAILPGKQMRYGIALGSLCRGATPSEYLDRLDLQNRVFQDDIRLDQPIS